MPIEYEMKILKETVEAAIKQFSEQTCSASWFDGVENRVLHILEDDPRAPEMFRDYQMIAMRELIRRGYWLKWDDEIGRPILRRLPNHK